jgi:hypothetical protein
MKRLTLWLYDNLPEALDGTCITRLDTIKSSNEYDAKTKQTMTRNFILGTKPKLIDS